MNRHYKLLITTFIIILIAGNEIKSAEPPVSNVILIDKAKNEIQVKNPKNGKPFLMGEKLSIQIDGQIIVLRVTFPMMSLSRCVIEKGREYSGMITKGTPVYRGIIKIRQDFDDTTSAVLNGTWAGYYQYYDSEHANVKGSFTLTIKSISKTGFTGDVNEPWSKGFPTQYRSFHSVIKNGYYDFKSKTLSFTKIYDFDGHKVDYKGVLTDKNNVSGPWSIGDTTGTWKATRR